jgi:putative glutathione S-transferase
MLLRRFFSFQVKLLKMETKPSRINEKGEFIRAPSSFRNFIARDSKFPPETHRYHLYVSWACPWAHRTLIMRALKGLDDIISLSVVDPIMGEEGWRFTDAPGAIPDTINHCKTMKELYLKADPHYSGSFSVPVLWDKKQHTIVNNESSEIIRMLDTEFNEFICSQPKVSYYPEHLRQEIDTINTRVYQDVNNGVYKVGFSTNQQVYEREAKILFAALDDLDHHLSQNRFLCGDSFTEADIRLFTTLVRFDPVYHTHFKCNLKSISSDYPSLLRFMRDVYQFQYPKIADTIHMDHIKSHYYMSQTKINPTRIVPLNNGPDLSIKVTWPLPAAVSYPSSLLKQREG